LLAAAVAAANISEALFIDAAVDEQLIWKPALLANPIPPARQLDADMRESE